MFSRLMTRTSLALTILCIAAAGYGQQTRTVESGRTSVTLSSTFTSALQSLNVTPGVVAPTHIWDGVASFPITGGALDLDTAFGNILHSGGLTLAAGNTHVRLQSFIIDTTAPAPVLTGLVVVKGKLVGRVPLFNVVPPAGLTLPLKPDDCVLLKLNGVELTLTSTAASALNSIFSVSAFAPGLDIGTARVYAFLSSK